MRRFFSASNRSGIVSAALVFLLAIALSVTGCGNSDQQEAAEAGAIRVCVTSTDVKAIAQFVGGDAVSVTGFVRGVEDAHVVEPTPSMVQALNTADLLVVVGLGLEEAWLPGIQEAAKNEKILTGGEGYLDLSNGLRTLVGEESRGVPNSYHPVDNPHYLIDPVESVRAAGMIRDALITLKPDTAEGFNTRYDAFAKQVAAELLGDEVAEALPDTTYESLSELCIQIEHGELPEGLGGQLLVMQPYAGKSVIGDHDLWPYFARRYGIHMLGYLEPEPGSPPTVPHLTKLMEKVKENDCKHLLTITFFNLDTATPFLNQANIQLIPMAIQPDSRENTANHLDWMRYNVNVLLDAFTGA